MFLFNSHVFKNYSSENHAKSNHLALFYQINCENISFFTVIIFSAEKWQVVVNFFWKVLEFVNIL